MENRGLFRWAGRLLVVVALVAAALVAFRPGTGESAAVRFRDPTVWLPTNATGEIVQVNGTTGDVVGRVEVGEPGDAVSALQQGSDALVLNGTRGELSRVEASTLQQVAMLPVPAEEPELVDGGARVHVVGAARIVSVDPSTVTVDVDQEVDDAQDAAVDGDGAVWFLDGVAGAVRRLAVDVVVTEGAGLGPVDRLALVASAGDVLLVDGPEGRLSRVRDGDVVEAGCLESPVGAPFEVAGSADPDTTDRTVLVTDPGAGVLHVVGGPAGGCVAVDLGAGPTRMGQPLLTGRRAFVPLPDLQQVVVVDTVAAEVRTALALPGVGRGNEIELLLKDGIVWFNEPDGATAGILDDDRVVRLIDKRVGGVSGEGIGGVAAGDEGEILGVAETDDAAADGATGSDEGSGGGDAAGDGDGEVPEEDGSESPDALLDDLGRIIAPSVPVSTIPDDAGAIPPASADVLTADFTFSQGLVAVGEAVEFVDRSQGGPTAWTWDFGDGTVATGPSVSHAWSVPGVYTVTLLVENDEAVAQTTVVIRVVPADEVPPRADFTFTSSQTVIGEPIAFSSTSTGSGLDLRWDFGDGTSATGATARKAWPAAGQYRVRLTASNELGTDTAEITVTVVNRVERPGASLTASSTSVLVGQTATFSSTSTGNPTTLDWDFDDGTTARGVDVRHAWSTPGTYTVTLTASNRAGSDRAMVQVTVSESAQPPVARITVSASTVETGAPVTFTSTSTGDPTGLQWDFGDGTSGSGASVSKTYNRPGTFTVRLTATNAIGSDTTSRSITVVANMPPPIPSFSVAPQVLRAGEVSQFTDTSTGGPVASWNWSFGDGTADSSVRNPNHIFEKAGTYTVTLTATNVAGAATTSRSVTVVPKAPSAAFTYTPTTPAQGAPVRFTDTSAGERTSWSWDFGNGATSEAQNPTATFAATGTYTVSLTVRNAGGSSTVTQRVAVNPPPPRASFDSPSTAITAQDVTFTNTSTAADPAQYAWTFDDGGTSTARSPSHAYASAGRYTVTLTVTNTGGTSSASRTVTVEDPPTPRADFTLADEVTAGSPVTITNTSAAAPPATYIWDFGDGTGFNGPNPPPKTYATPNVYTVRLTVTNAGGSDTKTDTIKVNPVPPPKPAFVVTTADLVATVVNQSTDAVAATVNWGDGSSPVPLGPSASHPYATPGPYTVTVTATNSAGVSQSAARPIRVFTVQAGASVSGLTVDFTGNVDGIDPADVSWSWTFGDTGTSGARNPSHIYAGSGTYPVTLTAAVPGGVARVRIDVTVTAPPPP